jgi:hypothetical protein
MDSLLNTSGHSGQQLPNNHFVDQQVKMFFFFSPTILHHFLSFLKLLSALLSKDLIISYQFHHRRIFLVGGKINWRIMLRTFL